MKALTTYGSEQLTEEQAHDLVSQLEPDHNGVVNYVEYINMVRAGMNRLLCTGCAQQEAASPLSTVLRGSLCV